MTENESGKPKSFKINSNYYKQLCMHYKHLKYKQAGIIDIHEAISSKALKSQKTIDFVDKIIKSMGKGNDQKL